MNEKLYFWYSAEQDRVSKRFPSYKTTTAMIKGEEVEYSECSSKNKPGGKWEDYKYLGRGTIYRVNDVIQKW